MPRRADDYESALRRPKPDDLAGASLFEVPATVDVPEVRAAAPSAPGSESSALAAEAIAKGPFRKTTYRQIMLVLAALPEHESLSRAELHQQTGISIATLCARLSELRPDWIEVVPNARASLAIPRLRVDGYRLTPQGRARVRLATTPRP